MNDVIIRAQDISKRYRVGQAPAANSMRDALAGAAGAPFRKLKQMRAGERPDEISDFWALRDVSFEVNRGDVVGIVGRNGAGKSTLLKVLSRITDPTDGFIELKGRVASLLEVGTGFHPDLTGRENVFLNGAILGMQRSEIADKFDEIVAFAEVDRFVDTQVKNYSSGMYLRLAFAVAAHLEPEILVVDEVLAVGDANFQKKCLGKMQDVAGQGRTVLFVSHNMSAVNRLCTRGFLLEQGRLVQQGTPMEITSAYLKQSGESGFFHNEKDEEEARKKGMVVTSVKLLDTEGQPVSVADVSAKVELRIEYRVYKADLSFRCTALFYTQGTCAFVVMEPTENVHQPGEYSTSVFIEPHLLNEVEYNVGISIFTSKGAKYHYAKMNDVLAFQVADSMSGASARGDYAQNFNGVVRPLLQWRRDEIKI